MRYDSLPRGRNRSAQDPDFDETPDASILDGRRSRWIFVLLVLSVLTLAFSETRENVADQVDASLFQRRAELELAEMVRRPELDAAAKRMANEIAGRPQDRRLEFSLSVREVVEQESAVGFVSLTQHVDLQRGAAEPDTAIVKRWERQTSKWTVAMDPKTNAVGMATATTDDKWLIFVAILGKTTAATIPKAATTVDLLTLETETALAVNQVRVQAGRAKLIVSAGLADAARAHSEDMAQRHYLATKSPEGKEFDDLLRKWKMGFSQASGIVGTTDARNDFIRPILDGWMNTRGSRKHILSRRYQKTGVGLATDNEGNLYFTQIFVRP